MKFSKQDTLIIKGVAILMLLGYHCFSSVDRFFGYDVKFFLLPKNKAIYIFEAMNICVGMFAFLSAYGLTKSFMSEQSKTKVLSLNSNTLFVTKRLITLVGSFILPAVLCVIATYIFVSDYNPYGKGTDFICNMTVDLLGLGGFFSSKLFIGTWWYMSFAILIVLLVPFTVNLYERYGSLVIVPYLVLPVLFIPKFYSSDVLRNMTRWLLIIPIGVIFAKLDLLDKLKMSRILKNKAADKIVKFIIMTFILYVMVRFRSSYWGKTYAYYIISSVLPLYFVYYLYEFVTDIPVLKSVLAFFGKHSSNIFYMHTFIRGVWMSDFTYSLEYAALIYVFMLVASLALSYAVNFIKYITKYDKGVKWLSDKIVGFENRIYSEKVA